MAKINRNKLFFLKVISCASFSYCLMSCDSVNCSQTPDHPQCLSGAVQIYLEPNQTTPLIFETEPGLKVCRKGMPEDELYGLQPPEETDTSNTDTPDEADGANNNQNENQATQISTTPVQENWFKLGLAFVNPSRSYFLMVEELTFYMYTTWGTDLLQATKTIDSAYCDNNNDTGEGSANPLYIIPPTSRSAAPNQASIIRYKPDERNYPNNLTIYVDGVPVPTEAPKIAASEQPGSPGRPSQDTAGPPKPEEQFILTDIPSYTVELIVSGYWIDSNRNYIANFRKKVQFKIDSIYLN